MHYSYKCIRYNKFLFGFHLIGALENVIIPFTSNSMLNRIFRRIRLRCFGYSFQVVSSTYLTVNQHLDFNIANSQGLLSKGSIQIFEIFFTIYRFNIVHAESKKCLLSFTLYSACQLHEGCF